MNSTFCWGPQLLELIHEFSIFLFYFSKENKKTKTTLKKEWFVDSQGFEPQMTEPKSVVLPLHHESVCFSGANLQLFSLYTRTF